MSHPGDDLGLPFGVPSRPPAYSPAAALWSCTAAVSAVRRASSTASSSSTASIRRRGQPSGSSPSQAICRSGSASRSSLLPSVRRALDQPVPEVEGPRPVVGPGGPGRPEPVRAQALDEVQQRGAHSRAPDGRDGPGSGRATPPREGRSRVGAHRAPPPKARGRGWFEHRLWDHARTPRGPPLGRVPPSRTRSPRRPPGKAGRSSCEPGRSVNSSAAGSAASSVAIAGHLQGVRQVLGVARLVLHLLPRSRGDETEPYRVQPLPGQAQRGGEGRVGAIGEVADAGMLERRTCAPGSGGSGRSPGAPRAATRPGTPRASRSG